MERTVAATKTPKARLEARIDPDLDALIEEAADRLHVTKTAFVSNAARDAALKVLARSDVTLMDPAIFDRMISSLDTPDESPELAALIAEPRRIAW